jgi:hypothetical protein
MAAVEFALPKREQPLGRSKRWPTNWALVVLDAALVRFIFPIGGVGLAMLAFDNGWGLFGWLGWSGVSAWLLTFVILDLRGLVPALGVPQGAAVLAHSPDAPRRC